MFVEVRYNDIVVIRVLAPCCLQGDTNISEEYAASVFRITLKMEAAFSSETLVTP
jgi:hypothetical protein